MWLFRLELKRILKSRRTLILLAIALLLSVAMAYLPISFEGINRPNEDGTVTELNGLAAIKYKQDLYKTSAGEVTPDRIKSALETYQSCVREYGPVEEEGFPLAVFIEKIVPFRHLLMGLPEAFADPLTGIGADLMDIDPNDIDGAYYEKCAEHLQDVMRNEQRENETAQQKALEKYSELDTPFYLHSGISKDAFDYIEFYILFLAILCVAIAAPAFAGEYQTGGDSILRTTKYGRKQLAITKILAAFTLFVVTFLVGITVHILILDAAFGTDCLKTSFQMRYSIINLSRLYEPFENCVEPVKYGFDQNGAKQRRNEEQFDHSQQQHLIPLLRDRRIDPASEKEQNQWTEDIPREIAAQLCQERKTGTNNHQRKGHPPPAFSAG